MFSKRLSELSAEDIRAILGSAQEDEQVEFKEDLATRDGRGADGAGRDPWYDGKPFGKEARRDIAKELVAFANNSGGTLVLGIQEDGEKRASAIVPIPRCRELADRLAASIAATTDPKLTSLEYAGVVTAEDGGGVVVFRVPQSHRAPHRDTDSLEAYYRVGDRSEPMQMRQIQDLAVQRSQGAIAVNAALQDRSDRMEHRLEPEQRDLRGRIITLRPCLFRATAYPLETIRVPRLSEHRTYLPAVEDVKSSDATMFRRIGNQWQPILRGVQQSAERDDRIARITVREDGLVECFVEVIEYLDQNYSPPRQGVPLAWAMGPAAQCMTLTEAFRRKIGRSDLEYAIDFEWRFATGANLLLPNTRQFSDYSLPSKEPEHRVSDYQLPAAEGLNELLSRLENDLLSSFGVSYMHLLPVAFDLSIKNAMLAG